MSSSSRSLLSTAGLGVGAGVGMSMRTARAVELVNDILVQSRMVRSYANSSPNLPRRCRSRQFSSQNHQPTLRLGPRPILSHCFSIHNSRKASNQVMTSASNQMVEENESYLELGKPSIEQEEDEEQNQRMKHRHYSSSSSSSPSPSSSNVRRRGWMESQIQPPDHQNVSLQISKPLPEIPNLSPVDRIDSDLLNTLTNLSLNPIESLVHQLDSSDLETLTQRLLTVHAIHPLRIIVDTISSGSTSDESNVRSVLDIFLGSEKGREFPNALKILVYQLVDSISTEILEKMIIGMSMDQITHLLDCLISTNVKESGIMAEKLKIIVSALSNDGLESTVTGIDISRRKRRIYLSFMSIVWLLEHDELEIAESLCSILEKNEVLHRVSVGYEGLQPIPHRHLVNISSEILISSREHLCKRDIHELMISLQRLISQKRFQSNLGEFPIQPWSDIVNLIIQDALIPGDMESFLEIQNFLIKTKFGSKVFPLRQEVREMLYTALDRIPPTPRWKIYQKLLRRGQPPPRGESTLRLAEHILTIPEGKQIFHSPDLSLLNESLRVHRHTLSGNQWTEYIRILLRRPGYSKAARKCYDAALDDEEHCIDVAGDHRLTLAMAESLGTPRGDRPPRDRAFAARVIREFARASPSLFNLPRESLTSLAQSFVAIGAIDAAYKVFEYILKSPTPPTEMDVAALLASAFHRNPEIAVKLLEQAIDSRAMSSTEALEVVLKATRRVEDASTIERIKEACKKMSSRAQGGR